MSKIEIDISAKAFNKIYANSNNCPVTSTMEIIGGKWKLIILWSISGGIKRFGELQKAVPDITKKMLTVQLRELEKDQIISRKVYAVVTPKVEYTVTELGKTLQPVICLLRDWG